MKLGLIFSTICLFFGMTELALAGPAIAPIISAVAAGGLKGALVRFALSTAASFVVNKLFAPDAPSNQGGGATAQAPDQGVQQRLQSNPNNKLPVVYGEARVFGSMWFADIKEDNQTMYFIIPLCEGPINKVKSIVWDNYTLDLDGDVETGLRNVTNARVIAPDGSTESEDTFLNGNLRVRAYRGAAVQPATDLTSTKSAKWNNGSTRNMPNVAYLYAELDYDRDNNVTGLSSKFGAVVEGKLIRTITNATTISSGTSYSSNPSECLLDYLTNTVYGCGEITDDSNIDIEAFYNHKMFCDEEVTHLNTATPPVSVTSKRFTCNGFVNTNETRDTAISDFVSNSQATLSYSLGKFQVISDKVSSSVYHFDEKNIFGDVAVVNEGFNSVLNRFEIQFNSQANLYQDDQVFLDITSSNVKAPFEPELVKSIRSKFNNNNVEVQRWGTTALNKSRNNLTVSFQTDLRALALQVGDVVTVKSDTYGFTAKEFRITNISETELGGGAPGFIISAQEYAAADYTVGDIVEHDTAPNSNFPNVRDFGPISDLTTLAVTTDSIQIQFTRPSGNIEGYQVWSAMDISTPEIQYGLLTTLIAGTEVADDNVVRTLQHLPAGDYTALYIRPYNTFATGSFSNPTSTTIAVAGGDIGNFGSNPLTNANPGRALEQFVNVKYADDGDGLNLRDFSTPMVPTQQTDISNVDLNTGAIDVGTSTTGSGTITLGGGAAPAGTPEGLPETRVPIGPDNPVSAGDIYTIVIPKAGINEEVFSTSPKPSTLGNYENISVLPTTDWTPQRMRLWLFNNGVDFYSQGLVFNWEANSNPALNRSGTGSGHLVRYAQDKGWQLTISATISGTPTTHVFTQAATPNSTFANTGAFDINNYPPYTDRPSYATETSTLVLEALQEGSDISSSRFFDNITYTGEEKGGSFEFVLKPTVDASSFSITFLNDDPNTFDDDANPTPNRRFDQVTSAFTQGTEILNRNTGATATHPAGTQVGTAGGVFDGLVDPGFQEVDDTVSNFVRYSEDYIYISRHVDSIGFRDSNLEGLLNSGSWNIFGNFGHGGSGSPTYSNAYSSSAGDNYAPYLFQGGTGDLAAFAVKGDSFERAQSFDVPPEDRATFMPVWTNNGLTGTSVNAIEGDTNKTREVTIVMDRAEIEAAWNYDSSMGVPTRVAGGVLRWYQRQFPFLGDTAYIYQDLASGFDETLLNSLEGFSDLIQPSTSMDSKIIFTDDHVYYSFPVDGDQVFFAQYGQTTSYTGDTVEGPYPTTTNLDYGADGMVPFRFAYFNSSYGTISDVDYQRFATVMGRVVEGPPEARTYGTAFNSGEENKETQTFPITGSKLNVRNNNQFTIGLKDNTSGSDSLVNTPRIIDTNNNHYLDKRTVSNSVRVDGQIELFDLIPDAQDENAVNFGREAKLGTDKAYVLSNTHLFVFSLVNGIWEYTSNLQVPVNRHLDINNNLPVIYSANEQLVIYYNADLSEIASIEGRVISNRAIAFEGNRFIHFTGSNLYLYDLETDREDLIVSNSNIKSVKLKGDDIYITDTAGVTKYTLSRNIDADVDTSVTYRIRLEDGIFNDAANFNISFNNTILEPLIIASGSTTDVALNSIRSFITTNYVANASNVFSDQSGFKYIDVVYTGEGLGVSPSSYLTPSNLNFSFIYNDRLTVSDPLAVAYDSLTNSQSNIGLTETDDRLVLGKTEVNAEDIRLVKGNRVFHKSRNTNEVLVYDTDGNQLATINTSIDPTELLGPNNGRGLVVNRTEYWSGSVDGTTWSLWHNGVVVGDQGVYASDASGLIRGITITSSPNQVRALLVNSGGITFEDIVSSSSVAPAGPVLQSRDYVYWVNLIDSIASSNSIEEVGYTWYSTSGNGSVGQTLVSAGTLDDHKTVSGTGNNAITLIPNGLAGDKTGEVKFITSSDTQAPFEINTGINANVDNFGGIGGDKYNIVYYNNTYHVYRQSNDGDRFEVFDETIICHSALNALGDIYTNNGNQDVFISNEIVNFDANDRFTINIWNIDSQCYDRTEIYYTNGFSVTLDPTLLDNTGTTVDIVDFNFTAGTITNVNSVNAVIGTVISNNDYYVVDNNAVYSLVTGLANTDVYTANEVTYNLSINGETISGTVNGSALEVLWSIKSQIEDNTTFNVFQPEYKLVDADDQGYELTVDFGADTTITASSIDITDAITNEVTGNPTATGSQVTLSFDGTNVYSEALLTESDNDLNYVVNNLIAAVNGVQDTQYRAYQNGSDFVIESIDNVRGTLGPWLLTITNGAGGDLTVGTKVEVLGNVTESFQLIFDNINPFFDLVNVGAQERMFLPPNLSGNEAAVQLFNYISGIELFDNVQLNETVVTFGLTLRQNLNISFNGIGQGADGTADTALIQEEITQSTDMPDYSIAGGSVIVLTHPSNGTNITNTILTNTNTDIINGRSNSIADLPTLLNNSLVNWTSDIMMGNLILKGSDTFTERDKYTLTVDGTATILDIPTITLLKGPDLTPITVDQIGYKVPTNYGVHATLSEASNDVFALNSPSDYLWLNIVEDNPFTGEPLTFDIFTELDAGKIIDGIIVDQVLIDNGIRKLNPRYRVNIEYLPDFRFHTITSETIEGEYVTLDQSQLYIDVEVLTI